MTMHERPELIGKPDHICKVVRTLETLRPETIGNLMALCADDVRFVDPFNDHEGRDGVGEIFQDMFRKVDDLKFVVNICEGSGNVFMLKWTYSAKAAYVGEFSFEGTSVIRFDSNDHIIYHHDYWDPADALYSKLPVIGWLFRRIQRAFKA